MPQGTVKHFDPQTGAGALLTDAQEELAIDPAAFAASGLVELRFGQRVRFEVDDADGQPRVSQLQLISL